MKNQYIRQAQYKKGFIVPLLIAIVAVLVIGAGVYVYKNKKAEAPAVVDTGTQQTNTQTPSVINKSSITVLSPSEGERFPAGSILEIKWNSVNVSGRVVLLLHVGSIEKIISSSYETSGTVATDWEYFNWRIPESFDELNSKPVEKDYSAYITIHDSQNKNIIARSGNFIIAPQGCSESELWNGFSCLKVESAFRACSSGYIWNGSKCVIQNNQQQSLSLTILSPKVEDIFQAGQTININWTPGVGVSYFTLWRSDETYYEIPVLHNPDTS